MLPKEKKIEADDDKFYPSSGSTDRKSSLETKLVTIIDYSDDFEMNISNYDIHCFKIQT